MTNLESVNDKTAALEVIQSNLEKVDEHMSNPVFDSIRVRADDGNVIKFKVILQDGIYQFQQVEIVTP